MVCLGLGLGLGVLGFRVSHLDAEEDEEDRKAGDGDPEADLGDHGGDDGELLLERGLVHVGGDERDEAAPFGAWPDCQDDHAALALDHLIIVIIVVIRERIRHSTGNRGGNLVRVWGFRAIP